ncbi:MAG: NUDIX hydrolase [Candidatus Poribacteria bacterium]|nr:NUDIX hydrolase [Candidatus Poribacteria bacterium]MDE0314389.1 NUDIX hydrolase [Candidatus Poribacteria bacterium]
MNHPKHIVAVSGLVRHPDGKILLIRSPRRGWEFPGGQVEEGENLIEALQREIQEESGVTASIGSLVGIYSNIKTPTKVMFGFLGDYVSGELTTSEESIETKWVGRNSVLQHISNRVIYDRIKDMLDFSGRVLYRVYTTNPYQIHEQYFL